MNRVQGIDVSRYQGEIDWQAVAAANYHFAVIRATVGNYYTDPRFYENWDNAKAAGLLVSTYHVVRPDQPADSQIDRLWQVLGDRRPDLPVALDVELSNNQSPAQITASVRDCLQLVAAQDGRKPIIYTGQWFWDANVEPAAEWAQYDLWVANYQSPSGTPLLPRDWQTWQFWQYSSQGQVPGIVGNVDLNLFDGSLIELQAYAEVGGTAVVFGTEPLTARVLASALHVRNGPDIRYMSVGQLTQGDSVAIIGVGGRDAWIEIKSGHWVEFSHAGTALMSNLPPTETMPLRAQVTAPQLAVRRAPSENDSQLYTLFAGDIVPVQNVAGKRAWVQIDAEQWCAFVTANGRYMRVIKSFAWQAWPLANPPVAGQNPRISQPFGANPAYYDRFGLPGHEGIDFPLQTGDPIYAVADGFVYVAGWHTNQAYGYHVRIRHAGGYHTIYAHLSQLVVSANREVKAGDLLGYGGSTGNSSGPHLHFTMKLEGDTGDWPYDIIDPTPFMLAFLAGGQVRSRNKIGFHTGVGGNSRGIGDYVKALDEAGIPAVIMCADGTAGLSDAIALIEAGSTVPHVLAWRGVIGPANQDGRAPEFYSVPHYNVSAAQAAADFVALVEPLIPDMVQRHRDKIWLKMGNELDKNRSDWLGRWAVAVATIMNGKGYKVMCFGFASGEPEPDHWQTAGMLAYLRYCEANPDMAGIALHEYSFITDDIMDGNGSKIGRFRQLFDVCDQQNIARPKVIMYEWGWEQADVPHSAKAIADIYRVGQLYAPYPQVLGAGIWNLGRYRDIADKAQRLIAPVTDFTLQTWFEHTADGSMVTMDTSGPTAVGHTPLFTNGASANGHYHGPPLTPFVRGIDQPASDWYWPHAKQVFDITGYAPKFHTGGNNHQWYNAYKHPHFNLVRILLDPNFNGDIFQETMNNVAQFYALGARDFVVLNEPNIEGQGIRWQDGTQFGAVFRQLCQQYKQQFAGIRLFFPGMSPGFGAQHRYINAAKQSGAFDLIDGVVEHVYTGIVDNVTLAIDQMVTEVIDFQRRHALDKPLVIGEFSVNRPAPAAYKAEVYEGFYTALARIPGVQAAYSFSSSWHPHGDQNQEGWLEMGLAPLMNGVLVP